MLWGAMMHAGSDTTIAETGGATIVQENEGGTSNMPIGVSYELTTAGTAQAATWTLGASNNWAAHVAFFKAAGDPPALPGNGGGGFDDRVRVENSVFVGNGTGAGARTFRSRWPNSTRDLKWDDQRADNRSRML